MAPRSNAALRLLGIRVRVAAGCDDAGPTQRVDELRGTVELGRHRHVRHRSCVEEPSEQLEVRIALGGGGMHAEAERRQERALEVNTEHARTDVVRRNLTQGRDELLLGRRHERRLKRGDSRREHRLARTAVRRSV